MRVWQGCCAAVAASAPGLAQTPTTMRRSLGSSGTCSHAISARNKTVSRRPKNNGSRCHEAVTTHALHRRMCADTCERNTLVNPENQTPTDAHEHEAADS